MASGLSTLVVLALLAFAAGVQGHFRRGKDFDRIFIIPLENVLIDDVLLNPFMRQFSQQNGARLYGNYFAPVHPSQPNYYTMMSGDYFGVTDDYNHIISASHYGTQGYNTFDNTIVDTLDDKRISWKVYAEAYPGSLSATEIAERGVTVTEHGCGSATDDPSLNSTYNCYSPGGCFFGAFSDNTQIYARKHVPFLSFDTFAFNEERCGKVVDNATFWNDWEYNNLPQYIFYVPDQCNDGHGCALCHFSFGQNIAYTATWLQAWITKLYTNPQFASERNVFIFVYDENDYASHKNQVYAVAYGPDIVHTPPTFKCPRQGCPATRSQKKLLRQDCYGPNDSEGNGIYFQCGTANNFTSGKGIIPPKEFYSAYSAANGLKADMTFYNHYCISSLVTDNWGLAPLWQSGSSARPLALY